MAKKDKKKAADKKARIAEKTSRKAAQKDKKASNKKGGHGGGGGHDSDSDSDAHLDLDAVLAEYAQKQAQFLTVTEAVSPDPPSARTSATLLGSPANGNELLLFGGEYFDGTLARFYNDLYIYNISRDEWRLVTSPNSPLPRSGHAWTRAGNQVGSVYLFGGEFSSPKQGTFYHYGDFWRLDAAKREWEKIETRGSGSGGGGSGPRAPPARSGHRMTYFKNYILLFGGFQDTSSATKYLADLWVYDTATLQWHQPAPPPGTARPEPRSSFSFLPHDNGAVLFGGYSRVKTSTTTKVSTRGGGVATHAVLKPMVHQDSWFLRVTPPGADAPAGAGPTIKWERRKRPVNVPSPARAGATMAHHCGRGIQFGGVHDVEADEESIKSEFFNTLYVWNVERNRFFPLALRRPKTGKGGAAGQGQGDQRGGGSKRDRAKADEAELLRNLAALGGESEGKDKSSPGGSGGIGDADGQEDEADEPVDAKKEKVVQYEFPDPRFNAALAVQNDVLYMYGGTFEAGDKEYTLDELWSVDLVKLDGCREVFRRQVISDLQGDDDEDAEDDDEDEEDYSDEEGSSDDDRSSVGSLRSASPATDPEVHRAAADLRALQMETILENEEDRRKKGDGDDEEDGGDGDGSQAAQVDTLPHPRPFETLRAFFARTSEQWQLAILEELKYPSTSSAGGGGAAAAAAAQEGKSVKEVRKDAFERAEAKWWDCREEILALEDEQEEAGIGEVVSLAERGKADAGGAGGAARRR